MSKQLLRLPQVRQAIGYSRAEIYRLISLGRFPKPIKIGERAVAWDADVIQEWIKEKLEKSEELGPFDERERDEIRKIIYAIGLRGKEAEKLIDKTLYISALATSAELVRLAIMETFSERVALPLLNKLRGGAGRQQQEQDRQQDSHGG